MSKGANVLIRRKSDGAKMWITELALKLTKQSAIEVIYKAKDEDDREAYLKNTENKLNSINSKTTQDADTSKEEAASTSSSEEDVESLRKEYEELTGGSADNRWKPTTLKKKIDEAKAKA